MKLILFIIFIIIEFNLILSKNIKHSDIFKGGKSKKNLKSKNKIKPKPKSKPIIKKDESSLKNKKILEESEVENEEASIIEATDEIEEFIERSIVKVEAITTEDPGPLIDYPDEYIDNTEELLKRRILFIACCLKGGLISDEQILEAYNWALKNNYLINDKYVVEDLAKKISNQFKSTFHNDWKIRRPKNGKKGVFSSIINKGKEIAKPHELRNRANGNLTILFKHEN